MFDFFHSRYCPIGIDVGSHAVRVVQFRPSAQGLALQAACRIELGSLDDAGEGGRRAAAAVRHALTSRDFRGRNAVLALPASVVHAKSVRLPQMPDVDLQQALQWEARDRFGFDVGGNGGGGGQWTWFRAGEVRRGTEVKDEILLFAVEGGVLNEYMQSMTELGLRVWAIDLGPCAMYRALKRTAESAVATPGLSAMLDIGHLGSQFFVVRGEDLVFYKHIEIGGKAINEAVAAKLGITVPEALQMRAGMAGQSVEEAAPLSQALVDAMRAPLEELARELDMCLRYYVVTFRGARPEAITVAGRQAGAAHIRETLAAALGLQVEEAQPLRGVQNLGDVARPDRSGEWALAAGLSLYPVAARPNLGVAA
jgi:type IV pilus assembly protein PilM